MPAFVRLLTFLLPLKWKKIERQCVVCHRFANAAGLYTISIVLAFEYDPKILQTFLNVICTHFVITNLKYLHIIFNIQIFFH